MLLEALTAVFRILVCKFYELALSHNLGNINIECGSMGPYFDVSSISLPNSILFGYRFAMLSLLHDYSIQPWLFPNFCIAVYGEM